MYRFLFLFIAVCSGTFSFAQDTAQRIIPGRDNAPEAQTKPYVIMIGVDGLRNDLADIYDAKFMKEKRQEGVQAVGMRPSFPTLTFPNLYTLATGLYPSRHGIVGNSFFAGRNAEHSYGMRDRAAVSNPGFYGGVPLWVLAEKHSMIAANFYWVGSEAPVDSTYSTYSFQYNEQLSIARRIEIVKEWLQLPEAKRPHLIMFYMPEVDKKLHRYGMHADSVRGAVKFADDAIRKLNEMTDSLGLPVNYIIVSDHGMIDVDTTHPIHKPESLDTTKFKVAFGSTVINLYARDQKDVLPTYRNLKKEASNYSVYLKTNTPRRWHYRAKDDCYNRIGDIVLVADPGKAFSFYRRYVSPGEHGYDNNIPEMLATFYAWGPAFKNNKTIGIFDNIHVYPLVAHLLGLKLICPVDGRLDVLKGILK